MAAATWRADLQTGRMEISRAFAELHGIDLATFEPRFHCSGRGIHPDDKARVINITRNAIRCRRAWTVRYRLERPGDVEEVELRSHVVIGRDGQVARVGGVARPVTWREGCSRDLAYLEHRLTELPALSAERRVIEAALARYRALAEP